MELASVAEVRGSAGAARADESVAVVLTTCNDAAFLREAVRSVVAQSFPASEVIVVDDGSDVSPAPVIQEFPGVVLLRKENGGLSSARNAGLRVAHSRYVLFLDADDRLEPNAIESGLACFRRNPAAGMVYGGHRRIQANGLGLGPDIFNPLGEDAYGDLLRSNSIGMHAAALYHREVLAAVGGFDECLKRCEDYDVYLRLALRYPIASHPEIVAEYRWYGQNISRNREEMLRTVLLILDRQAPQTKAHKRARLAGQRNWRTWYSRGQLEQWHGEKPDGLVARTLRKASRFVPTGAKETLRETRLYSLLNPKPVPWPPPRGAINFGSLGTTTPVNMDFGWGRGTPIDRYYIERFLERNAADIRGRVLEIGSDTYSKRYGASRVTRQDVLSIDLGSEEATLIGDLSQADTLPADVFDCIVLTQTLQLIFDLERAARHLHAALRQGGVLLLTVPGISQVDRGQWKENWCWSFTAASIAKLFAPYFRSEGVIESYGNVFAATAFLQGIVVEEVDCRKLDVRDAAYPLTITMRARKS